METLQWTSKSRYGDVRTFTYMADKSELHVHCENTLCVSYSSDGRRFQTVDVAPVIVAVDPDGGPYLGIGTRIYRDGSNDIFCVKSILSECFQNKKRVLDVVLAVQKEESSV